MLLLLENQKVPESGHFELNVQISADLKVSAKEAQHKVSMMLFNDVSYLMYGDEPQLVVGKRVAWRVPAFLSVPQLGKFGPLGALDVDAETGEVQPLTEMMIMELTAHAQALTARYTSTPAVSS